MPFLYASFTDKGPRSRNEDAAAVRSMSPHEVIACVADGVGGQAGGDTASKLAVTHFTEALQKQCKTDLHALMLEMHKEIRKVGQQDPTLYGLATTFSGCVVTESTVLGTHTGDSRVHLLRGNGIKQLTQDQTEVARLVAEGKLPKKDIATYPRRHVLEGALGTDRPPNIQSFSYPLQPRDRLLLTTDGVHGLIPKCDLRDLSLHNEAIEEFVANLADLTARSSPQDNYTIVAIELV